MLLWILSGVQVEMAGQMGFKIEVEKRRREANPTITTQR